jgi:hypothetical protein
MRPTIERCVADGKMIDIGLVAVIEESLSCPRGDWTRLTRRFRRLGRLVAGFLMVALASFLPSTVAASPRYGDERTASSEDDRPELWYGWQTIVADGLSLAVLVGGAAGDAGLFIGVGYGGFVLSAPIAHIVHENPGRAVGDLGLRIAVPLIAASIAHSRHACSDPYMEHDCNVWVALSAVGSMVVVSAIDAAFLTYERLPYGRRVAGWSPVLVPTSDGMLGGVVGTF